MTRPKIITASSAVLLLSLLMNFIFFPHWGVASVLNSQLNSGGIQLKEKSDIREIEDSNQLNSASFEALSKKSCPNLIKTLVRYKNYEDFKAWLSSQNNELPAPMTSSIDFVPMTSSIDFTPMTSSTDFTPMTSSTDFVPMTSSTDFTPMTSSEIIYESETSMSPTDAHIISLRTSFPKLDLATQAAFLKSVRAIKKTATCLSLYESLTLDPAYKSYIQWLVLPLGDQVSDSLLDDNLIILESSIAPLNPNDDTDLTISPPLLNRISESVNFKYQWQKQKNTTKEFYQKRSFKESSPHSYLKTLDPTDPTYSESTTIDLDFPFSFYGDNYTSITAHPNGYVTFNAFSDFLIHQFEKDAGSKWDQSIVPFVAPFKINPALVDPESVSISSQYLGSSPERELIIQWDGSLTNETQDPWRVQLHLRETDASLFFAYDLLPAHIKADDVQIGIQDARNKKASGNPIEYSFKKLYDLPAPVQIKPNFNFENIPYTTNFFPKNSLKMNALYRVVITPSAEGVPGVPFTSSPVGVSFEHPLVPELMPPVETDLESENPTLPVYSEYLARPPLYSSYAFQTVETKEWTILESPAFNLYPSGARIRSQSFDQVIRSERIYLNLTEDQYRSSSLYLAVSPFKSAYNPAAFIGLAHIWAEIGGKRYDGIISGDSKIFIAKDFNLLPLDISEDLHLLPIHIYVNFLGDSPPGIYDLDLKYSYE